MKEHPLIKNNSLFQMNKEYGTLINEIIYHHIQIDEKSLSILEKIKDDSDKIMNALSPLSQIGVRFNLALAGGATRDLIFKKQDYIKDLDYIFSVDLSNLDICFVKYFDNNKNAIFAMMDKMPISDDEKWNQPVFKISSLHPEKKLFEIMKILLSKELNISHSYTDEIQELEFEKGKEPPYADFNSQHKLTGILKIDDKKLNYPIDILLTNYGISDFLYHMDFDICKTSILLQQGNQHRLTSNIDNYLNAFNCDSEFLDDYMNKTITLNMKDKSIKEIEFSMSDHYYRIKEKYPEHELQLIPHTDEHKAFKFQWELSQSLNVNKTKNKIKKI